MKRSYFIYILTNFKNSTFYIGVTNNLARRMYEHKHELIMGFTKKYKLHKLVYYEQFPTMLDAIRREKQLKNWRHNWKISLIKKTNPFLADLLEDAEINSA